MFSHSKLPKRPASSVGLSWQDLLDGGSESPLSDYLSLAVTRLGEHTVISLTTTGRDPVTYSTVISSSTVIDLQSLVFVAQHDERGA